MSSKYTQTGRVFGALLLRGAEGITATDFLLPNVVDGGPPILNLSGRVNELRARGHRIVASGRRGKCVIYRLVVEPRSARQQATPTTTTREGDGAGQGACERLHPRVGASPANPYEYDLAGGDR